MDEKDISAQMKIIRLTVSKICHEFANCLNHILFIQHDIINSFHNCIRRDFSDLSKNTELLVNVLSFFRELYSTSNPEGKSLNAIKDLYEFWNITLDGTNNLLWEDSEIDGDLEKLYSSILYTFLKSSHNGASVKIQNNNNCVHFSSNLATLPQQIKTAIHCENIAPEIFNIIVLHSKTIAKEIKRKIDLLETKTELIISVSTY